uniref:Uncharacterized protein n=1 Tax=Caenorhabditis japonica TaxID=281687 RepID=A0A8R1E4D5_CAEJA
MALKTRLASVTERPVLFQILKHEPDGNVVQVFCESLDLFGKFLTPIELSTKIEPILLAQNPLRASISYSKCLTTIKESTFRDIMTVLEWLKSTVERHLQGAIEESLKVGNEDCELLKMWINL